MIKMGLCYLIMRKISDIPECPALPRDPWRERGENPSASVWGSKGAPLWALAQHSSLLLPWASCLCRIPEFPNIPHPQQCKLWEKPQSCSLCCWNGEGVTQQHCQGGSWGFIQHLVPRFCCAETLRKDLFKREPLF